MSIDPDRKTLATKCASPDLSPLRGQLLKSFPDAAVKISQLRDHVVVEGQARDAVQAARIIELISAFMDSIAKSQERRVTVGAAPPPKVEGKKEGDIPILGGAGGSRVESKLAQPKIINLLRIPDPLEMMQAQLAQSFPGASVRLSRVGNQVIVEGQARDGGQVTRIIQTVTTNIMRSRRAKGRV